MAQLWHKRVDLVPICVEGLVPWQHKGVERRGIAGAKEDTLSFLLLSFLVLQGETGVSPTQNHPQIHSLTHSFIHKHEVSQCWERGDLASAQIYSLGEIQTRKQFDIKYTVSALNIMVLSGCSGHASSSRFVQWGISHDTWGFILPSHTILISITSGSAPLARTCLELLYAAWSLFLHRI